MGNSTYHKISLYVQMVFILIALFSSRVSLANEIESSPRFASLPFTIDETKRMDEEEIKNKREGTFLTGIPQLGSDPLNGQGIGADLFLYSNGQKSDPLFEYTPYRSKYEFHSFFTNKDEKEAIFSFDIPYVMNSPWRLRFEVGYEDNPNLLYFGRTAQTMNPLSYRGQKFSRYGDYQDAIKEVRTGGEGEASLVTDALYNTYRKQEVIFNMTGEKSYWDGTLRLLVGFEAAQVNISTFDGGDSDEGVPAGTSRLQQEKLKGLLGVKNNFLTIMQLGIIYDTRDFEPDPTQGLFLELTDEFSVKGAGSDFDFNKIFIHAKYYKRLLPGIFDRMIFAA